MPALPDPTWRDLAHLPAPDFLTQAMSRVGRVALVSSFGADSAILLHIMAQIDRSLPVIFIDTLALFPETLAYQQDLAQTLGLRDIRRITPDREALFTRDPEALLHLSDRESCCQLRKAEPLERALQGFDGWITGRKRYQSETRASLEPVEREPTTGRIRLNPLAKWNASDIAAYLNHHALPRHPLVARGYPSIGCQPCTSAVRTGEDPRAGRWRGSTKIECGIHFIGGVPQPKPKDSAA